MRKEKITFQSPCLKGGKAVLAIALRVIDLLVLY